ncbi:MAG: DUF1127 domain-containing protein [Rhodobacteraceae bacterium]|nr:MAG: DUF1127 domain-containing protein [Paracoccaceae bacterium]
MQQNITHPTLSHRLDSHSGDSALRTWFRAAYRRWQRNKMIAAFESLDDATLRDIGVYRSEIRSVVDGFDDQDLKRVPVMVTDDARRWK